MKCPVCAMATLLAAACLPPLGAIAGTSGAAEATESAPLLIRGALTYRERIALPPQSRAVVELRAGTDGDAALVGARTIELAGRQVPIPFELAVDRGRLKAATTYHLHGRIVAPEGATWASTPVAVDAAAVTVDLGTLMTVRAAEAAAATRLRCGDRAVAVDFSRDPVWLAVDGETFDLRPVPAASGARYEAVGDPATTLWNKGASTTLVLRGETFPECRAADAGVFRARGNEPAWQLEIGEATLTLVADYGQKRIVAPLPQPDATARFRRYAACTEDGALTVTIFEWRCSDNMTGMPYPHAVSVDVGGRTLHGCGGDPASLLHGEWVVEAIGSMGMFPGSRVTIDFSADGRIAGRASCNSYTGSYVLGGEGLRIGPTATTMMACQPELMQQEKAFLALLQQTRRFELGADGALVMVGDEHGIRARRP